MLSENGPGVRVSTVSEGDACRGRERSPANGHRPPTRRRCFDGRELRAPSPRVSPMSRRVPCASRLQCAAPKAGPAMIQLCQRHPQARRDDPVHGARPYRARGPSRRRRGAERGRQDEPLPPPSRAPPARGRRRPGPAELDHRPPRPGDGGEPVHRPRLDDGRRPAAPRGRSARIAAAERAGRRPTPRRPLRGARGNRRVHRGSAGGTDPRTASGSTRRTSPDPSRTSRVGGGSGSTLRRP